MNRQFERYLQISFGCIRPFGIKYIIFSSVRFFLKENASSVYSSAYVQYWIVIQM